MIFKKNLDLIIFGAVTLAFSRAFEEPFSSPKFLVAFIGLLWIFTLNLRTRVELPYWFAISLSLFVIASVAHPASLGRYLLGSNVSNEGILYYFLILGYSSVAANKANALNRTKMIGWAFEVLGIITSILALLQRRGFDLTGVADAHHPIALLGNEDFVSSIQGAGALTSLCLLIFYSQKKWHYFYHGGIFILLNYATFQTGPFQGIIAEIIAVISLITVAIWQRRMRISRFLIFLLIPVGVIATGSFGVGPLGVQLQQVSLLIRSYLWRAAWIMFQHSPLFGVGIDGYADEFRRFRDPQIIAALSTKLSGENAHNVLLETAATLGLVGLSALLLPQIIAVKNIALKFRKREFSHDAKVQVGLFLYFWAILLISPATITNAIPFWIITGTLIGAQPGFKIPISKVGGSIMAIAIVTAIGIVFYALMPALEVFSAQKIVVSNVFSIDSQKRIEIYMKAIRNPFCREAEFLEISNDLMGLHKVREARSVLLVAVGRYPANFELRRNLWIVDGDLNLGSAQASDATALNAIDPLNPSWRVG